VQKQSWAGFSQFATSNRGHLAKVPASQQLTTPAQPPRSIMNRARDARCYGFEVGLKPASDIFAENY